MKKRLMHLRYVLGALVLALAAPLAIAGGLLDDRRFVGDIGPLGEPATEKGDVITFTDGRFHSAICDQWGYGKGEYRATRDAEVVRFEVTTLSEDDGRLHWRGTVHGATLEGTVTYHRKPRWWRSNPAPIEYWVKATAQR